MGYLPSWQGDPASIEYDKLTHVNYAFVLPTSSGGLQPLEAPDKLRSLVSLAHANGVQVLIAVGGWSGGDDSAFHSLASSAAGRSTFADTLMWLVNEYNLDGVDVDWEYPEAISAEDYTALMAELSSRLRPAGKLLTAAVAYAAIGGAGVASSAFQYMDFLNIMAYDAGDGADHSPYSRAESSLGYWLGKGLSPGQAVLGVPFYSHPGWMSYADIVARDPQAPYQDVSFGEHYNGIATIQAKTQLAASQGSGIMIWELSHDTHDSTSLLRAIDQVVIGG